MALLVPALVLKRKEKLSWCYPAALTVAFQAPRGPSLSLAHCASGTLALLPPLAQSALPSKLGAWLGMVAHVAIPHHLLGIQLKYNLRMSSLSSLS